MHLNYSFDGACGTEQKRVMYKPTEDSSRISTLMSLPNSTSTSPISPIVVVVVVVNGTVAKENLHLAWKLKNDQEEGRVVLYPQSLFARLK